MSLDHEQRNFQIVFFHLFVLQLSFTELDWSRLSHHHQNPLFLGTYEGASGSLHFSKSLICGNTPRLNSWACVSEDPYQVWYGLQGLYQCQTMNLNLSALWWRCLGTNIDLSISKEEIWVKGAHGRKGNAGREWAKVQHKNEWEVAGQNPGSGTLDLWLDTSVRQRHTQSGFSV